MPPLLPAKTTLTTSTRLRPEVKTTAPATSPAPASKAPWAQVTIKLPVWEQTPEGYRFPTLRKLEVAALVWGKIALQDKFMPRPDNPGWVVTCLNLGLALCVVQDLAAAKAIGEYLAMRCQAALGLKDMERMVNWMPSWAREWCKACTRAGGWVDPVPFLKG